MIGLMKKVLTDDRGQDLAEYGIALAVIAVGVGAIAVMFSQSVRELWERALKSISGV